jgi:hypothetical protein
MNTIYTFIIDSNLVDFYDVFKLIVCLKIIKFNNLFKKKKNYFMRFLLELLKKSQTKIKNYKNFILK